MIDYIINMNILVQLWLVVNIVMGLGLCLGNWLRKVRSILTGGGLSQNTSGMIMDMVWLTSVVMMTLYFIK